MYVETEARVWAGAKMSTGPRPTRGTWVVYVLLDDVGALLYVGMTGQLPERLRAHRGMHSRTRRFVYWVAEQHQTQASAALREAELIQGWDPMLNVAGR